MSFSKLLQQGYLDWLTKRGRYGSQADFAMELGVSPIAFNRHYNGRTEPPADDPAVGKYAAYFGDRVYDELGLARKEETFLELKERYDRTPPDKKEELLDLIDAFLREVGAKPLD